MAEIYTVCTVKVISSTYNKSNNNGTDNLCDLCLRVVFEKQNGEGGMDLSGCKVRAADEI